MRIYIDLENIKSLISLMYTNEDIFDEFKRYVKKSGVEVQYNFPWSKEYLNKNPYYQLWFQKVGGLGGANPNFLFCPENKIFPSHSSDIEVKSNFLNIEIEEKERYNAIYMLNIEHNIAKELKDKHSILICTVGDECQVIESLLSMENLSITAEKLTSWDVFCPDIPLSDIVLCDEHYFKDKDVYDKDNHELLRTICKSHRDPVNIVILTNNDMIHKDIDLELEAGKIRDVVSGVTGVSKKKCNVTILTSTKQTHSRHLITNYYRMVHTYNYHLNDPKKKKDINSSIEPHIWNSYYETSKDLLEVFQRIANKPDKCFFSGEKKSNFLNFSK